MNAPRGPLVVLEHPVEPGTVQETAESLAAAGVVYAEFRIATPSAEVADVAGIGVRVLVGDEGPQRAGPGEALLDDCALTDGRVTRVGPTAARVREEERAVVHTAAWALRPLFDAGFRVVPEPAVAVEGFSDVELAACAERAAIAAFLADEEREALVEQVRRGWDVHPRRLFHLAVRERWEASRRLGSYLPSEWDADGFIHLSGRHQLLTPANRFYRGRTDLVVLVLDAHYLGDAVVWERGTGTLERFPHLYAAITPEAVLGEVAIAPGRDGTFLLPAGLS